MGDYRLPDMDQLSGSFSDDVHALAASGSQD